MAHDIDTIEEPITESVLLKYVETRFIGYLNIPAEKFFNDRRAQGKVVKDGWGEMVEYELTPWGFFVGDREEGGAYVHVRIHQGLMEKALTDIAALGIKFDRA